MALCDVVADLRRMLEVKQFERELQCRQGIGSGALESEIESLETAIKAVRVYFGVKA